MVKSTVILLCAFLLSGWKVYAQQPEQVPAQFAEGYLQSVKGNATIYSGKERTIYPSYYKGTPYLISPDPAVGTLCYDNVVYPNVRLQLDLYRGELQIASPEGYHFLILQPDRLNYADFLSHRLIYYYPDGLKGCPAEGYYILLHQGTTPVLEKNTCLLQEEVHGLERRVYFQQSVRYYILKDEVYYTVKSKSSLLNVFRTHKKELNRFIKQQNLNFKRETEKTIIAVTEEYERLIGQP